MASELSIPSTAPPPTTSWSSLLTKPFQPPNQAASSTLAAGRQLLDGCKSSKGIAVAVVDANAIIQGGERLSSSADRFVSVAEVLSEIRDPTSRHRLSVLPFTVETMEPSPESLKKVISFARATGDLQTLSDVDLKLIALTYSLEAQIHGTKHLRDSPPPIHIHNVRRLPEKELPGWGANVPNLEEWEALEGLAETAANNDSKILPLKDLSLNVQSEDNVSLQDGSVGNGSENNFVDNVHSDEKSERSSRYPVKKREVKIDGKKMGVDGIDASQGQYDEDAGDWNPAVSRGTRRRFLKRQAKREMNEASLKNNEETDVTEETESAMIEGSEVVERTGEMEDEEISSVMEQMRLEGSCLDDEHSVCELNNDGAEHFETSSQATESVDTSYVDDLSSEQSWSLRSLSDSSIACVTGDFAMQNVILQIGLRLLAPGGMQIRELHRWVLKCHACNKVTNEIGRVFCPKCGNGGTLRKVAVTVGENGVVLAARRQRFCLRGTKFSLPLPQGGRAAITKNPILREDQLPQRFGVFFRDDQLRNSKGRNKKGNNKDMDFCAVDDIFSGRADKKEPLKPAVRQALTMFSGRKNPNDNHYSRAKH